MLNVGIFCGGYSSEYEISIKSASTILSQLPKEEYHAFLIKVTQKGWFALLQDEEVAVSPIDFTFQTATGKTVKIDLAQIYIHGNPGENGKLQAYFEMKNLPYINSNALSSELSFDKWFCNQFLRGFGINVAKSLLLMKKDDYSAAEIGETLKFPLFVKPSDSGSSYGISKVYKEDDLPKALEEAFKEGRTVVCESFLKGKEITCGVYRNAKGIQALPCIEIVSHSDFFDYEAKYMGNSEEICPARISPDLTLKIQDLSQKIYQLLQLRSIARIDFMLIDEIPYVIEVNTTPGFTQESLVPKMLREKGLDAEIFWKEIYDYERSQF